MYSLSRDVALPFLFFNDTATTEIYTLSLHDALPILDPVQHAARDHGFHPALADRPALDEQPARDRKSTRLNSSHANISYAVFCLKKKKKTNTETAPSPTNLGPPVLDRTKQRE